MGNAKVMFSATVCGGSLLRDFSNVRSSCCKYWKKYDSSKNNEISRSFQRYYELYSWYFMCISIEFLGEMAKHRPYSEALKEAQERGIAETDPTLDVEGK